MAQLNHQRCLPQLEDRFERMGYSREDVQSCLDYFRGVPVTINFNPEKLVPAGEGKQPLPLLLAADDRYRNHFETGATHRDDLNNPARVEYYKQKETKLYQGRFDALPDHERPEYGAVNPLQLVGGGALIYGPCYLVLKHSMSGRVAVLPRDSRFATPEQLATLQAPAAALLQRQDEDLQQLMKVALAEIPHGEYRNETVEGAFPGSNYMECQVHGEVRLDDDVEALMADERLRGTPAEGRLRRMADQHKFPLRWYHAGPPTTEPVGPPIVTGLTSWNGAGWTISQET
ncbi:DUF3626 domain-containing protein [bacterium]|nr:DUF3626 domain-containing protein [bacterium]